MKRLSFSLTVALIAIWGGASCAQGPSVPPNPLRPSRPEPSPAPARQTAPAEQQSTQSDSNSEAPAPVYDANVEPARFTAPTEARPVNRGRRVHAQHPRRPEPVRRVTRRPGRATGSPFQLLQFGTRVQGTPPRRYRSAPTPMGETYTVMQEQPAVPEPVPSGKVVEGEVWEDGTPMMPAGDCCGGVGCDQCGAVGDCGGIRCPSFRNFEFFAGVHGFTGAPNLGETGSFGFDYGFNWGAPLWCLTNGEIGVQAGFRHVGSNYDGASYTTDTRNQYFITAGLFRRVDYGLQGGVVFDYLGESWYYNADITQIRGEISWMFPACHELGYWFTANLNDDSITGNVVGQPPVTINGTLTVDQHRFFYRRRFVESGAEGRLSAGFTGAGDGLLGADFQIPLSDCWALESTFTYLIPDGDARAGAFADEAWNVAFGLVWYPGARKARGRDYFRPLFDVADNGSLIVARP